jgi:uncharacterized protein DUF998
LTPSLVAVTVTRVRLLRICALSGMLAAILLIVSWVIAGFAQDDYDWATQDVSDLGAATASHGWIQDTGDVASGVLLIVFALGLHQVLEDRWSGRIGMVLMGAFGVIVLLTGAVFDLDCSLADEACRDAEHSSQHSTHELLSSAGGTCALAAPFVLAQRFRRDADWQDRAAFALACGVAAVSAFVLYLVFQWETGGGIAQRLLIGSIAVFVAVVARRLWVLSGSRNARLSAGEGGERPAR